MKDTQLSGWHRLSEYWISEQPVIHHQTIVQVMEVIKALGFEPDQVEKIQDAITAAIQHQHSTEEQDFYSPATLVRVWVPEKGDTSFVPTSQESRRALICSSSGKGFFLMEKTVGDQLNPWKVSCRMVDVLLYGGS